MIPILYDTNETVFVNNGIGRLRDCISCIVTEERNGIYECDFEYPITGANYELIQIGRIIGVTHDDTGDVQPFDIVSFEKPIDGVVTFHCTHISYRQSYMTVTGTNINSLSDAFTLFGTAQPSNPFNYQTDKTSTGYLGCADGIPRTVRQMLGGIEGSILDAYGGEYEFDKWNVILHNNRGTIRDFSIRYGVNMTEYNDEVDSQGAYSSCIPYWANGEEIVVATKVDADGITPTGRGECVPLDLTEKFENKPTTTQLRNTAKSYMNSNNSYLAGQTINVSFARLQDMGEFAEFQNLLTCQLCDTINVVFPDYQTNGNFKIVKTVWNVLNSCFDEMELGTLSVSLAEALGISENLDRTGNTFQNLSVLNDLYVGGDISANGTLTIGGHSSPIGTQLTETKNIAITTTGIDDHTATQKTDSITLAPGVWILVGYAPFNTASGSGTRICAARIYTGSTMSIQERVVNAARNWSSLNPIIVTTVNSTTTAYMEMAATVTSTGLDCTFRAVRIA